MGAPDSGMEAADQPAAETLLTAFKTINAAERRKHASVLNYWLSIRGNLEFPPLHDFDPLEISDFGQSSVLVKLIGGGHDAEVRHVGEALQADGVFERIIDAPNPSILSSIARKLPIVAISREFLAFEDDLSAGDAPSRCWVTLLPLSSSGAWVDYVYAFVSVEPALGKAAEAGEAPPAADIVEVEAVQPDEASDDVGEPVEPVQTVDQQEPVEPADVADTKSGPGFAKLFEGFAGLAGFYGQSVKVEPVMPVEPPAVEPPVIEPAAIEQPAVEPLAIEPVANEQLAVEPPDIDQPAAVLTEQPAPASEGPLQSKLADVRAKADEVRAAKLRANMALYEGLGAAYDFALDAEDSPEEYLRLVEAQGLKIQLRSPMAPVVKLVFNTLSDDSIIASLEAVLAWAIKHELPRGSLAARINEAGGIAGILRGESQPT